MTDREAAAPLLAIDRLSLVFEGFQGRYHALSDVSLHVGPGETVGLVGETGCGKSVLAKSVLRLLPDGQARYPGGRIDWKGEPVLTMSKRRLRQMRAVEVGFVFQDPMTFLDPLFRIGDQLTEIMLSAGRLQSRTETPAALRERSLALLARMKLPDPERVFESYPHQLSGGMRQRVLIAMALSGRPELLIADEPTTALDVSVQAQILNLMKELVDDFALAILLISHDLGVVGALCRRIVVMYAGTIVEDGPASEILARPAHPYSRGLIDAVPRIRGEIRPLKVIPGQIPNLLAPPSGCRFAPRCPRASELCRRTAPQLRPIAPARAVACHHPEPLS